MTRLTLRIVQGADRGKIFSDLKTPITIGREEGNSIQLNDERISRYHCKIQEDNDHLVLTDLESTNGTRVNGQDCQLRILRFGDIISVGRSILLFGTHEQISSRVQENLTAIDEPVDRRTDPTDDLGDFDLSPGLAESVRMLRDLNQLPDLPSKLSPSQAAQLAELFEYFHARFGEVISGVNINEKRSSIDIDLATWQLMLQMYSRLAELIRGIADPEFRLPG